jgi:hypothetical protein
MKDYLKPLLWAFIEIHNTPNQYQINKYIKSQNWTLEPIVGTQTCHLKLHPDICPELNKETNYFKSQV